MRLLLHLIRGRSPDKHEQDLQVEGLLIIRSNVELKLYMRYITWNGSCSSSSVPGPWLCKKGLHWNETRSSTIPHFAYSSDSIGWKLMRGCLKWLRFWATVTPGVNLVITTVVRGAVITTVVRVTSQVMYQQCTSNVPGHVPAMYLVWWYLSLTSHVLTLVYWFSLKLTNH